MRDMADYSSSVFMHVPFKSDYLLCHYEYRLYKLIECLILRWDRIRQRNGIADKSWASVGFVHPQRGYDMQKVGIWRSVAGACYWAFESPDEEWALNMPKKPDGRSIQHMDCYASRGCDFYREKQRDA